VQEASLDGDQVTQRRRIGGRFGRERSGGDLAENLPEQGRVEGGGGLRERAEADPSAAGRVGNLLE
jgi:hypothetical protein